VYSRCSDGKSLEGCVAATPHRVCKEAQGGQGGCTTVVTERSLISRAGPELPTTTMLSHLQQLVIGQEEEPVCAGCKRCRGRAASRPPTSLGPRSPLAPALPRMDCAVCVLCRDWTPRPVGQTITLKTRASWSRGSLRGPSARLPEACWTLSGCPAAWGCSKPVRVCLLFQQNTEGARVQWMKVGEQWGRGKT
jgi:hypothetical protein